MSDNSNGNVGIANLPTADAFLRELSPLGTKFGGGYDPDDYVYRGHADARWPLLPTALRDDVLLEAGRWKKGVRKTNLEQIKAEFRLVLEFFRVADRNGLPLPDDSQRLRSTLVGQSAYDYDIINDLKAEKVLWPPDELLALFALAQHHRLPTRLLDWTSSAYMAAFFAASKAATWRRHGRRGATHLSVWAIARSEFDLYQPFSAFLENQKRISLVTAPSAGNPNLRAQKALFLVDRPQRLDLEGPVDTRPWDKILRDSCDHPILYKLCLPIEEASRLLRLLAFEGIDAAALFPGFDGVKAALDERKYWESKRKALKRKVTVF